MANPVTIIRTIVTNHRDEAIYVKIEFHKNKDRDRMCETQQEGLSHIAEKRGICDRKLSQDRAYS